MDTTQPADTTDLDAFILRWERSGAAERANYQMFLAELCDVLGVPRPDPAGPEAAGNRYVFDRTVTHIRPDGQESNGYIDLYRAGYFVLETKQGVTAAETAAAADPGVPRVSVKTGHGKRGTAAFDRALERAYHQARGYITSLSAAEGRPPFLIVCDVGYSIDLYAEFTGTGGHYERFPDPRNHRILLTDLRRPEIRERLRAVWIDPHSLDPSKRAAEVTRDIAGRLARLAKSLEDDGHQPQIIAGFLQRCLFTMFAEDVGLLPEAGFKTLLDRIKDSPQGFPVLVTALWKEMATGTQFSALLFQEIAHFNGGLFEETTALPLSRDQLGMLIDAAGTDWSGVEPSIFGTLLTRALDPRERHKLGAHYTPRAYVERLVRPTIIDPLREEWDDVRIAAANLHREADAADEAAETRDAEARRRLAGGDTVAAKETGATAARFRAEAKRKDAEALGLVTDFHRRLCGLTVLDPACGTANFLYVTLEHLKRLEAEVLELVTALGGDATFEMREYRVRPEQFLGLELSPRAVAIAQLVLWIGYFQWQRRTTGRADTGDRPLLPRAHTIRQQDAVLISDERLPRRDPDTGQFVTVWDGTTTKPHPVTGREVPDETARIPLYDYVHPRRAEWPEADYIVGNPPFIGMSRMRDALGDGYTEALRQAWKGAVPDSADFVMYWWRKAAEEVARGRTRRFGFITTNSIHQTFNRRVIEPFLADETRPLHLAYAIPDHPWVDSTDGAAVRIAMTVADGISRDGLLEIVKIERPQPEGEVDVTLESSRGIISSKLTIGVKVTSGTPLKANQRIAFRGMSFIGNGFVISKEVGGKLAESDGLGFGDIIKPTFNAKDLTQVSRNAMAIDLFGLSEREVQEKYPAIYTHLLNTSRIDRLARAHTKDGSAYAKTWWCFGKPRPDFRSAISEIATFIVTPMTAKHRFFVKFEKATTPDQGLICFALTDPSLLSVLSSSPHTYWATAIGGKMGVGNDPRYNNTTCFETFPFPALEDGPLKDRLRDLGERLDAHRKRQQAAHLKLTMTGMYNVLEKLRRGEALTAKDRALHDDGLVTLLKQLHDEIDDAVLEAYGWPDLRDPATPLADRLARAGGESLEQELLGRLVALNHERTAEEARGQIRWLRPDYQDRAAARETQPDLDGVVDPDHGEPAADGAPASRPRPSRKSPASKAARSAPGAAPAAEPLAWPERNLPEQVAVIRRLLPETGPDPQALSARFGRKSPSRQEQIAQIIETLRGLGQV